MTVNYYVGLSGSGKTTLAYSWLNEGEVVIDSDSMRRKIFGNENCQSHNALLFETMLKDTIYWLRKGYNVHYVATNLVMKHRVHFIQEVRRSLPETTFNCVVCIAPVEECKRGNRMRDRQVPENIIDRQLKSFQMPLKKEGWNSVSVVKTRDFHGYDFIMELREKIANFGEQHNKWHTLTLKEHSDKVAQALRDNDELMLAAIWHDLGKVFTKTIGSDGYWHYYNHENVSAYYALLLELPLTSVYIINYHMIFIKHNNKIVKMLNPELLNMLKMFAQADAAAHK